MMHSRLEKSKRKLAEVPGVMTGLEAMRKLRLRSPSPLGKTVMTADDVVLSLTSFPARIDKAWVAIETLLRQDSKPGALILVLAEEEFPQRTLPRKILQQTRRGLDIMWAKRNTRSYKKLLPVRLAFPEAPIATFDDDLHYRPWALGKLVGHYRDAPTTIVGHRGWEVSAQGNQLAPYTSWQPAHSGTPSSRVFLTGGAGALYPPESLPMDLLANEDLALRLCPSGDDVWFWAVAQVAKARSKCLGNSSYNDLPSLQRTPSLQSSNWDDGQNDVQLRNVVRYFGLSVIG
jgi:hypothetical protein